MMKNFYKKACPSSRIAESRRGITIWEVLIVITVISILIAIVLPGFAKIKKIQILKSTGEDIVSIIGKARSQTLASLNSSVYGVHFETNKVVLFTGDYFLSGDVNNKITDLISPAVISNITLSGSAVDVYFNRLTGLPSATGTIELSVQDIKKTITISAMGSASVD